MKTVFFRIVSALVLFALLAVAPFSTALAAEDYSYQVDVSTESAENGILLILTLSLDNYSEDMGGIRGFQIDVSNNAGLLLGAAGVSLVTDQTNVMNDTVVVDEITGAIRHLFVKSDGTLDYSQSQILQISVLMDESITETQSYSIPIRLLVRSTEGEYTYESAFAFEYVPPGVGDVNGDGTVNAVDLVRLMHYLLDSSIFVNQKAIDPNGDNRVNILDVVRLLRYLAGFQVEIT